ncbi:hypothetical protein [Corallococcus sp. 4LFB]|uniref:hypothetical protein n=1 Tax=Corallococcus sp. 4LFB TaxID=3383249 RepID=UPI003975BAD4
MKRLIRAAPLAALLTLGCDGGLKPAEQLPYVGPCEGLASLTLSAEPTTVRSASVATLTAGGGSGHYSFRVEPGGSSGDMRGNRFVAGATPGEDTLTVVDDQCGGSTSVRVKVIAGFGVAPARAMLRPGTSFQIASRAWWARRPSRSPPTAPAPRSPTRASTRRGRWRRRTSSPCATRSPATRRCSSTP